MFKPREIKILKSKFVASAEKNVTEFIIENKLVLSQYAEATIQGLKERDRDKVKEMSYQLFSVAKGFGREDISNIAEIIYISMNSQTFFYNEDIFKIFEDSLTKLSNIKTTNVETKRRKEAAKRRAEEEQRKRRAEEEQRKRRAEEEQRKRRNFNSTSRDPWQILGVNRNDNVDVIKKAYKNKIKKFHPDVLYSKDLPDEIVKFTEEKIREFTEAYETIRRHNDTVRRRMI